MDMPEQPRTVADPLPARVTIVDFDMPFGSMIAFMLKWALAAVPAMIILLIVAMVVSVVLGGALTALMATASFLPSGSQADTESASIPPLVVTMRRSENGWQLTNDSSVSWSDCLLSIHGHSAKIGTLMGASPVQVRVSDFSDGGPPEGVPVSGRDVSLSCREPGVSRARIYLLP
jgi:hypothetical protein